MDTNLILGIIGTVTGTIACLLELKSYLHTRAKLKIVDSSCNSFFVDDEYFNFCRAAYTLTIINESNQPISIYSFVLKEHEYKTVAFCDNYEMKDYDLVRIKELVKNHNIHFDFEKNILIPIINLDAFESIKGILFFPITIRKPSNPNLTLCIETSRGTFKYKIEFDNFHT